MKRTWTIIGVDDVPSSFKWYQSLFGQTGTRPGGRQENMITSVANRRPAPGSFRRLLGPGYLIGRCAITGPTGPGLIRERQRDSAQCWPA